MARMPEATEQLRHAPVRLLRAVFSGVGQLLLAADRLRAEEASQDGTSLAEPCPAGPLEVTDAHTEQEEARSGTLKITGNGDHDPAAARRTAKPGGRSQVSRKSRRASRRQPVPPRFRSLDSTGNVRLLSQQDIADLAEDELNRRNLAPAPAKRGIHELAALPGQPAPASQAFEPGEPDGGGTGMAVAADMAGTTGATGTTDAPGAAVATEAVATADAKHDLPIAGYDGLSLASLRARLRNLTIAQLEVLIAYEARHANRGDVITMFANRINKLRFGPRRSRPTP